MLNTHQADLGFPSKSCSLCCGERKLHGSPKIGFMCFEHKHHSSMKIPFLRHQLINSKNAQGLGQEVPALNSQGLGAPDYNPGSSSVVVPQKSHQTSSVRKEESKSIRWSVFVKFHLGN